MRFDVEIATAQTVADYLNGIVDPAILADCPCVTFFDPMSIDEANRIVVMVPDGTSEPTSQGNFTVRIETGIKSQWTQKTVAADFSAHFRRVNEMRDKLWPANLAGGLQTKAPAGLLVEYIQPRRNFSTSIREGWIYSETNFTAQVMVTGNSVTPVWGTPPSADNEMITADME